MMHSAAKHLTKHQEKSDKQAEVYLASSSSSHAAAKKLAQAGDVYGEGDEGGAFATKAANIGWCGGALILKRSLGVAGAASNVVRKGTVILLGIFPGPDHAETMYDLLIALPPPSEDCAPR